MRVRVAEPSPQVVDHVDHDDQMLHDASTTSNGECMQAEEMNCNGQHESMNVHGTQAHSSMSAQQHVAPVPSPCVAIDEPGQVVPPQVVEHVRVRVAEPVCVTHDALQTDQADYLSELADGR